QADGSRPGGASFQVALLLERLEGMVDGRGGGQPNGRADLADGWRIAAGAKGGRDVVDDALLAGGVVPGHGRLLSCEHSTERLFDCQAQTTLLATDTIGKRAPPAGCALLRILHAPMARSRRSGRQANLARSLNLIAFLPLASRAPVYGRLVWALLRDDRVPPAQKMVLAMALGYVALPFDILPRWLPIIGALDDVAVVVIAVELFIDGIPAALLDEKLQALGIERAWLDR